MEMVDCPNHPGKLRITPTTCAGMWKRAQGSSPDELIRLAPCIGCQIGETHAGVSPPAASTGARTTKSARTAPRLPQALIDLEDVIRRGDPPGDEPYPGTFAKVLHDLLHRPGMDQAWTTLLAAHDKHIAKARTAFEAAGGRREEVESLPRHPDFPVIAATVIHSDFITATAASKMPTRRDESGIHKAIARDARRLADQIEKAGAAYPDGALQALGRIEARALLLAESAASGTALLERSERKDALQITLCRLLVQRMNDWTGSPHYGTVATIVSALLHKTVSKQTVRAAVRATMSGGV